MGVLYGFLIFVEIVVCALLIVVIFMQKSKGGMGGSAFGGGAGEAIFGSRMGNVLTKSTVVLGIIFLLNTLLLTVLTTQRGLGGVSVMEGAAPRPVQQQQQRTAPGPAPAAGADWADGEMQPAGDVPDTVDMPVPTVEADAEDVIQIPSIDAQDVSVDMPDDVALPTEAGEDSTD